MAWFECIGGSGSSGHNYSTDEQVVGTWIDGSTIYEKTIARTFTSDEVYTVFASGIGIAFIQSCFFEYTSESSRWMSPSYISTSSASNNICVNSDVLNGALRIVNQTRSSKYFVVTIRYTKSSS